MTFTTTHEPSGEWHFGVWRINRPTRNTFSIRLFKWAMIWEWR